MTIADLGRPNHDMKVSTTPICGVARMRTSFPYTHGGHDLASGPVWVCVRSQAAD
jgi:hypothetical protein